MRNFSDWVQAYVNYASFSEAPKRMHFWSAVSAVAGALRRRVWIDQAYFKWHANHYIIFVAPPGIVSKSTTAAIAMDILRMVPGITFGPDVVTWPALVTAFAACSESFSIGDDWYTQCALTLSSSEFGNLVNPTDREMIDLLVTLWDSQQGAFKKVTKGSGNDTVENPWINMIACTTPSWIAGNFPEYVIGGGFTSRCLFVYTETKDKLVPYPSLEVPQDLSVKRLALAQDLEHIATTLVGPYYLSAEAIEWGRVWYRNHYANPPAHLTDDRFSGYLARKQTHLHKLAMVLAAGCRDEMLITAEDLVTANIMISELEEDLPKVFAKIGRTEDSIQAERFIKLVHARGAIPYEEAYRYVHTHFSDVKDFEGILNGAIRAGYVRLLSTTAGLILEAVAQKKPTHGAPPGA